MSAMWAFFGAAVDLLHALAMAAWALGLPLLFLHRWPRATRAFAVYAIAFVLLNQLSMWTLRECFLTTVARYFWEHAPDGTGSVSREWFTVRVARAVFGLTPSHRLVKRVSEALIFATAIGVLASAWRMRRRPLKVAGQAQRG